MLKFSTIRCDHEVAGANEFLHDIPPLNTPFTMSSLLANASDTLASLITDFGATVGITGTLISWLKSSVAARGWHVATMLTVTAGNVLFQLSRTEEMNL